MRRRKSIKRRMRKRKLKLVFVKLKSGIDISDDLEYNKNKSYKAK